MTRRGSTAAIATGTVFAALSSCAATGGPEIRVVDTRAVEVRGLTAGELQRLRQRYGDRWAEVFPVRVVGAPPRTPPMAGSYQVEDAILRFVPAFALLPGVGYTASFSAPGAQTRLVFEVPRPDPGPPVTVRAVYPSGEVLPANVLRFYLHFSAPVAQGNVYEFIGLLDEHGTPIDLPFLEIAEELWNPAGTRLTLLVDPGRVKQELLPRKQAGPVFTAGRRCTLVVDAAWPDAHGRPLAATFRKRYRIDAADGNQPAPSRWRLRAPRAGSRDALLVEFAEPVDHALLQRMIEVVDATDRWMSGAIEVDAGETRWRFRPEQAWGAGDHALVIDVDLEDPSGNNVRSPFEVDVHGTAKRRLQKTTVRVPFRVQ